MPIFLTNIFIYSGLMIFSFLFLFGINDLSFETNFFNFEKIDTRLIVMFLLAEPHFAMTIPLMYGYRKFFLTKPLTFLFIPLLIIICSSFLFFLKTELFFLVFLIANVYHVNRQSVGFFKLQARGSDIVAKLYEVNLHILTISCLYFAMVKKMHSLSIALIILMVVVGIMIGAIFILNKRLVSLKEFFVVMQGFLIFLPIVIFNDIILAFAVGISIHYLQYIVISWKILRNGFGFQFIPLISVIMLYSMFSTGALSGLITSERISLIVFIPTMLQLLHFYYDGFIWKRSEIIVNDTMKKAFSK